MRVLVVEDEPRMAQLIRRSLAREGYAVDVSGTGEEALWMASEVAYDALVLDLMIPPPDGVEVCRRLRARGDWVPVLMLTARDAVSDRVAGLDAGADDYLTKPFAVAELAARVRALVRRAPAERPSVLRAGDVTLDPGAHTVHRGGELVELTPKAFAVLELLLRVPGRVVSRSQLMEGAWDFAFDPSSNVVEATVRRLREALDRPGEPSLIETVRGSGYRLRGEG